MADSFWEDIAVDKAIKEAKVRRAFGEPNCVRCGGSLPYLTTGSDKYDMEIEAKAGELDTERICGKCGGTK